jgi:hypothetical protein
VGMRAHATGRNDAREARLRARYGLTPHPVGELDGSRHSRGAKALAHTPPVGGDLGVELKDGRRRLRFYAGATATEVATLNAAGGAMVPVVATGTRETACARTVAPLPLL